MTTRLSLPSLIALVVAAWLVAGAAWAQTAGRVVLAVGDVVAVRGAERVRLAAGASVSVGDTIATAAQSHAQIRFADNGLVAIKPESEFRIEAFTFSGRDEPGDRVVFRLLRGGFRTLTGSLGSVNREQYQVLTTQATIGIRGTHYLVQLCEAGTCPTATGTAAPGLWGGVLEGRILCATPYGDADYGSREYFHVPDGAGPERVLVPPSFLADALKGRGDRRPSGQPVLSKVPEPGFGFAVPDPPFVYQATEDRNLVTFGSPQSIVVGSDRYTLELDDTRNPALALGLDSEGRLTSFANGRLTAAVGTASIVDAAGDPAAGAIRWGRWAGPGSTIAQQLPNGDTVQNGGGNLHYVYGSVAFDLPTSGKASFAPVGGTRPTDSTGGVGTLVSGGRIDVDFTAATAALSGLAVDFSGATYSMGGSAGIVDGRFSTSGIGAAATCAGAACKPLLGGNFAGFFAGTGGAGIGLDYFFNLRAGGVIEGVAGYRRCAGASC